MDIKDRFGDLEVLKPIPEPCRFCGQDTNRLGYVDYCGCAFDDEGDVVEDCGSCSDGLICVDCDDRFSGLALSLDVFY